jgi:hypothetical protein
VSYVIPELAEEDEQHTEIAVELKQLSAQSPCPLAPVNSSRGITGMCIGEW